MSQITRHPRLLAAIVALALTTCLTVALTAPAAHAAAACPNEAVREQQHATYLPDCRGFELVSPAEEDGGGVSVEPPEGSAFYQAASEGAAVAYSADEALPGSLSSGQLNEYLSSSVASGSPWQTLPLGPDNALGKLVPHNVRFDSGGFAYMSPDLTCGVEETTLPLATLPAGESAEEYDVNLYAWNAASDSYELVTNVKPKKEYAYGFKVEGVSAGCSRVIFESEEYPSLALVSEEVLYEWDQGALHVASVLPDGTPSRVISQPDKGDGANLNVISSDGSRVFFDARADEGVDNKGEEVFMRLPETEETVEVSASQTTPAVKDIEAKFEVASKGGQQVFFVADYGLTSPSSTGGPKNCNPVAGAGCDLYDYETATGTLTDISADTNPEDVSKGAQVMGVLGISEDGGIVYFSAAGQLVPDQGNTEAYNETEGEANVYAYHDGQLSYVTSIGRNEAGGSQSAESVDAINDAEQGAKYAVSRVSADGGYLLFATDRQIKQSDGVSYDNTDAATGDPDFEEYEYSLAKGTVTCVSCDPTGAQPHLRSGAKLFGEEFGQFTTNSKGELFARNLAADGEVSFQTTNPVLPQAVNESLNVYEWQPEGVSSCPAGQATGCLSILDSGTSPDPTYFEGASENGENVYIATYSELALDDTNELRSMYDVRVNGGFPAPAESTQCSGETCQGAFSQLPGTQTPGSSLGIDGGNVVEPAKKTTTGKLEITKHTATPTAITLTVKVPAKGRLTASGTGLKKTTKSAKAAGSYKLKIKLTKAEQKKLKAKKTLALKVKVAFKPASGKSLTARVTVAVAK